jgi:hypothetical protein
MFSEKLSFQNDFHLIYCRTVLVVWFGCFVYELIQRIRGGAN